MLSPGKGGSAPVYGHALGHATYERHRPEQTLLYRLIEKHYPALVEQLEFQGKSLPTHVHREFEAYLKCGPGFTLSAGFLLCGRCDRLTGLLYCLARLYRTALSSRLLQLTSKPL